MLPSLLLALLLSAPAAPRVVNHALVQQDTGRAATNAAAGAAFLAAFDKRAGVKVLPSGLRYQVIKLGNGRDQPAATDQVRVRYRGTLVSGQEFDASPPNGAPARFVVGSLIPGWAEALQRMRAGAKWRLAIPAELAYGSEGIGNRIGPNEVLLFEVELVEIVGKGQ